MREATHAVEVEHDVKVTMPDGAVLLADVFHPAGLGPARRSSSARPTDVPPSAGSIRWASSSRRVAGTGSCSKPCAGPTGPKATSRSSPSATTAVPQQSGSPRNRGGMVGSAPTARATWASRSGRWRRPRPRTSGPWSSPLSSTHSSWYLGGTLALELMINWDLSALELPPPGAGWLRHGDRTRRDRTQAAHAPGGVRPPPGGRRAPARRG